MSWDKNTVNLSSLDEIAKALDLLEIPYTITVLQTVDGWGINDVLSVDEHGSEERKMHKIRRLNSEKIVVLEKIERRVDCDDDDAIVSYTFNPIAMPKEWVCDETIDVEDEVYPLPSKCVIPA
jgi:hypothetical protein